MKGVDHRPLAEKGIFVILAPLLVMGLGVVAPLLIFALPLFALLLGPFAIWKGVRWLNRRDDPRHVQLPPDPP